MKTLKGDTTSFQSVCLNNPLSLVYPENWPINGNASILQKPFPACQTCSCQEIEGATLDGSTSLRNYGLQMAMVAGYTMALGLAVNLDSMDFLDAINKRDG